MYKIQNDTVSFGKNLSIGTYIFNLDDDFAYELTTSAPASASISTTVDKTKLITDKYLYVTASQLWHKNTGYSVFLGEEAGKNDDLSLNSNVFVGYQNGYYNTSGYRNTIIGANSFTFNTIGFNNTAVGGSALAANTEGSYNIAIGTESLNENMTGSNNIAIGYRSLRSTYQSNNISIGHKSGYENVSGSGNIFLGYQSGYTEHGSNKLYIENSNSATPLIYGDFANDSIIINGDLSITGKFYIQHSAGTYLPSSATDNGTMGQVVWGEDYIYICIQDDTWKRVAISTW